MIYCIYNSYWAPCTWKCCPWRLWSPGSPCGSLLAAFGTSWSRRLTHPHLSDLYWPPWTCWASWPSGSRRGCSLWMAHFPGRARALNESPQWPYDRSENAREFKSIQNFHVNGLFVPSWPLWLACSAQFAARWRCRCTPYTCHSSTWWSCPPWSEKVPRWTLLCWRLAWWCCLIWQKTEKILASKKQ